MRQSLARGVRRDLKRAFGPEALELIDKQGAALESVAALLLETRKELTALQLRYVATERLVDGHEAHVEYVCKRFAREDRRRFWQRLRYLVLGR